MSTIRLPRTVRLDPSDTFVFERAAEPGEWAVAGSFLFFDLDASTFSGKRLAAFRAGFVGVRSFGFSTLVAVAEAGEAERQQAVESLAAHLVRELGAPSLDVARAAAEEEIAFAASLCDHPPGTIIAQHRVLEAGTIRERFRTLEPRLPGPAGADRLHAAARAFEVVETDEDVDLVGLMQGRGP